MMETYRQRSGLEPDFQVHYQIIPESEGGRSSPPFQHIRWDWLYEDDDPEIAGISMIWPEAIDQNDLALPDGVIPTEGEALMFIVVAERRPFHANRIKKGVKGYWVEGARKVAICTVTRVLAINENPSS